MQRRFFLEGFTSANTQGKCLGYPINSHVQFRPKWPRSAVKKMKYNDITLNLSLKPGPNIYELSPHTTENKHSWLLFFRVSVENSIL